MGVGTFSKKQYNPLVLPRVLYGILDVEPRTIKHLVDVIVMPFYAIQLREDDVHLVEDEKHMQLWVALKIVVYFFLCHNLFLRLV